MSASLCLGTNWETTQLQDLIQDDKLDQFCNPQNQQCKHCWIVSLYRLLPPAFFQLSKQMWGSALLTDALRLHHARCHVPWHPTMQWHANKCRKSTGDKARQNKKHKVVLRKPVASYTIVMIKPSLGEQWALPPWMLKTGGSWSRSCRWWSWSTVKRVCC